MSEANPKGEGMESPSHPSLSSGDSRLRWGARPIRKRGNVFTGEVSEWLKEHAWKVCVR